MIHVVLPAYNEELSLPPLLERFSSLLQNEQESYHIWVVDDGSADNTTQAAQAFADRLPLTVLHHDVNAGLGQALLTGFKAALENADENDCLITMDSDDTHSPSYIPAMVQKLRQDNLDVVVASRYQHSARQMGVPSYRRLLSNSGNLLYRLVLRLPGLRDYTCGYRCFRAGKLSQAIEVWGDKFITSKDFSVTGEITIRMTRVSRAFGEVPFVLHYEMKKGASKMHILRTVWSTLKLLIGAR
jgi:dolichol-phosphate mannosyltransferase